MTDESDDENDANVIVLHKLSWRSDCKLLGLCYFISLFFIFVVLNRFIETLDQRLDKLHPKESVGNVAKKVRKLGDISMSEAPHDAPSWTVANSTSK